METPKKVDGIKKISKEELEKSRKLLLDYIGENEEKKKPVKSVSKKIDGIFKVFSRNIEAKPSDEISEKEIAKGKKQLKNVIGIKGKKALDKKRIAELKRKEEASKIRLEMQERQREKHIFDEKQAAELAEKERNKKIAEAKKRKEIEDKRRLINEQEKERKKKLKIEELEKQEEEKKKKLAEIENDKESERLSSLKKKEEQTAFQKKKKEEDEKKKKIEKEKKKIEEEKIRKEKKRQEKIKIDEEKKRKRELEEEKKRLKEEKLEKRRLRKKRFKNKFKNFKFNFFKSISNFKKNIKKYLKNFVYFLGISISIFVLLYLIFSIIILKTEHDSRFSRGLERYLKIPAYLTEDGIIRYYDYLEEKKKQYPDAGNLNPEEVQSLRVKLLKDIVIERLAIKYSIENPYESGSIVELSKKIVNDPEVNQVGLNRINKIKTLVNNGESFEQVATKYGDKRERIDFDSSTEAYSRYGESVSQLQINQVSDIVPKDGGYYMFKRFQSNEKFALSYVFIKGTSLHEFLEEYVANLKVWSFVE